MIDLDKITKREDLTMFESADNSFGYIRIIPIGDNEFLFNARDCALVLEYKNTQRAIRKYVPEKSKTKIKMKNLRQTNLVCLKLNRAGEFFITEEGLYRLISASHMPKAEDFKSWVFGEILPAIRKNGKYDMGDLTKSQYCKTIQDIPGWIESVKFKQDLKAKTSEVAKSKHRLKSCIWNTFTNRFNNVYSTNLSLKITNLVKKYGLVKRPTIREYLDYKGLHMKAYIIFEMLHYGDAFEGNPEKIALLQGLRDIYYNNLSSEEKSAADIIVYSMHETGCIPDLDDNDPMIKEVVA